LLSGCPVEAVSGPCLLDVCSFVAILSGPWWAVPSADQGQNRLMPVIGGTGHDPRLVDGKEKLDERLARVREGKRAAGQAALWSGGCSYVLSSRCGKIV
jgi:hypothetical protein